MSISSHCLYNAGILGDLRRISLSVDDRNRMPVQRGPASYAHAGRSKDSLPG